MTPIPALPGHTLFLFLLQIALILTMSRLLGELAKRLGQPPVVGELLAGIVLGPSLLGALWPAGFHAIFPADPTQVHLLEVVSWIGMVLLLLLTGIETDVRLLRSLGRTAFTSSALGMVIPFLSGLALGEWMPDSYLADPQRRHLFSCFLATAMSISAMPVIAKILMDLELTKRNIGVVILSAGVVDDTTGWLILSIIAGIAGSSDHIALNFIQTLVFTALFLAACRFLFYPGINWLFRIVDDRSRTPNSDLVVVVVFAFVLAAITEKIGIHAVFGAFVAGCLLRQVPRLRPPTIHRLETIALPIFAPIFFGSVGLKVDLHAVTSPKMLLIALAVATFGKLVGCTAGGLIGRMSFWESLSIGVAMNARGAMELVVALVGLNLGILNPAMFAIVVVIAIVTSFMAPIGLRLTLKGVKMSPEERARIQSESERRLFDRTRMKTLLPTAGGPNALAASRMASALLRGGSSTLTVIYVEPPRGNIFVRFTDFVRARFKSDLTGRNLQQHLDQMKAFADEQQARIEIRKVMEPDVAEYVCREAARGFDLILLGGGQRSPLRAAVTTGILQHAPCHVGIVLAKGPPQDFKRILVATNGSFFSRAALELAVLYAENIQGTVTVLYSMDEPNDDDEEESTTLDDGFRRMMATTLLTTLSPLLTRTSAKVTVIVRSSGDPNHSVMAEARTGLYQLLVIGAENRAVQHRLKVGYDVEQIVHDAPCAAVVVIPKVGEGEAG